LITELTYRNTEGDGYSYCIIAVHCKKICGMQTRTVIEEKMEHCKKTNNRYDDLKRSRSSYKDYKSIL
jgi:hypothetical protein